MRISDWSSDVCSSDLNGIEYNLNSLLVSIAKPYTEDSGWGVNLAYTYSDAEENRTNASNGETYYFDGPRLTDRFYMSTGVPKHRLVLSGIYDLGWDTTFSGKLTVASPTPRNATNCNDVPSSDFRSEEHTSELQSLMRISYA